MKFIQQFCLAVLIITSSCQAFKFEDDQAKIEAEVVEEDHKPREERKIPSSTSVKEESEEKAVEEKLEPKEEEIQGRFFLKDKLCSLGLMSASQCQEEDRTFHATRHHSHGTSINSGSVQYVQPVKLVAHGAPIAAVPLSNNYR